VFGDLLVGSACEKQIRQYWEDHPVEDESFTEKAFYGEPGNTGTWFKHIWGSEPIEDLRVIEFQVTDHSHILSGKGARAMLGTEMGPEWDDACNSYWRQRDVDLKAAKTWKDMQKRFPDRDYSWIEDRFQISGNDSSGSEASGVGSDVTGEAESSGLDDTPEPNKKPEAADGKRGKERTSERDQEDRPSKKSINDRRNSPPLPDWLLEEISLGVYDNWKVKRIGKDS
jgi:hypothetical protein